MTAILGGVKVPEPGEVWVSHEGKRFHVDHIGVATETGEVQVAYFRASEYDEYRRSGPGAVNWLHRTLGSFLGVTYTSSGARVRRFTPSEKETP